MVPAVYNFKIFSKETARLPRCRNGSDIFKQVRLCSGDCPSTLSKIDLIKTIKSQNPKQNDKRKSRISWKHFCSSIQQKWFSQFRLTAVLWRSYNYSWSGISLVFQFFAKLSAWVSLTHKLRRAKEISFSKWLANESALDGSISLAGGNRGFHTLVKSEH